MRKLDLNADLGEGTGNDDALLQIVTSASIACGGHAGNAETMHAALRAAEANGVRVGAHPGFNDPEHFGRRNLDLPHNEIAEETIRQISALSVIAAEEGVPVAYVKLHGALANMAAADDALSDTVFGAIQSQFPHLAALVLEGSAQYRAALRLGIPAIAEAYADRAYTADGLLAPRTMAGAVVHDAAQVRARCQRLALDGEIVAIDGSVLRSDAVSVCLHGDTPGAIALAGQIRADLLAIDALNVEKFTPD